MFFSGSRARGSRIREEGSLLPLRPELNFIGSGITAADNPAAGRTDVTLTGGGGTTYEGFPVFNVMDAAYGALGDDSTNDRAAIQAAIDAAYAAGGGIVLLPTGHTFRIGSTLFLYPGVHLVGNPYAAVPVRNQDPGAAAYRGGPILRATSATMDMVAIIGTEQSVCGIRFDSTAQKTAGAAIRQWTAAETNALGWGLLSPGSARLRIERCLFYRQYDSINFVYGINGLWMRDLDIVGCARHGIYLASGGVEFHISGLYLENNDIVNGGYNAAGSIGLYLGTADGIFVGDSDIIGFETAVSVDATNVYMERVMADSSPYGFVLNGSTMTLVGCYAAACYLPSFAQGVDAVTIGGSAYGIELVGMFIRRGATALRITNGASDIYITGGRARSIGGGSTVGDGIVFTGITDNVNIVNFNLRDVAGTKYNNGGYAHTNLYVRSPGLTDVGS